MCNLSIKIEYPVKARQYSRASEWQHQHAGNTKGEREHQNGPTSWPRPKTMNSLPWLLWNGEFEFFPSLFPLQSNSINEFARFYSSLLKSEWKIVPSSTAFSLPPSGIVTCDLNIFFAVWKWFGRLKWNAICSPLPAIRESFESEL